MMTALSVKLILALSCISAFCLGTGVANRDQLDQSNYRDQLVRQGYIDGKNGSDDSPGPGYLML